MRWIDVFRISLRMLLTNGLRSMLTILGIGVAISLIVSLIGLGYGLQNITIGSIVESKTLLSMDIQPASEDGPKLTTEAVEQIKQIEGIREVTPVTTTSGEIRLNDQLASVAITSAYPSFLDMEGVEVTTGNAYIEGATEVILTPQVLELLDLGQEGVVGATARISYADPTNENASKAIDNVVVVGVAESTSATIYVPFTLLNPDGKETMSLIKAVAKDRNSLASARDAIGVKGYLAETLIETLDQARSVFRWVTIGLGLFGTIALVVAAIGMFNTLTISLMERTREIGIMKAIGVTDTSIKKLFLTEAGLIGFLGGLAGIGLGVGIDHIVNIGVNQVAIRYGGLQLNLFQYPDGFLLTMVLYPIVLAIITGFYPAIRASRLNPLKALRYE